MLDHEWPHRGRQGRMGDFIARVFAPEHRRNAEPISRRRQRRRRHSTTLRRLVLNDARSRWRIFFSFLLVLPLHRDAAQLDKWKLMMKRKELLLGNTTLSPWLSSRLSRPSPCRRSPGHQHKNLV